MNGRKFLTKSRFKAAYECPVKLYYLEHLEKYGNNMAEDSFLKSLAQGGFQVGALAKIYYPGGIDLEDLRKEESVAKTNELLKRENVVIFEAALQWQDYLVRVDILEKSGNSFRLIEVKGNSFGFDREDFFARTRGKNPKISGIHGEFESYLVDVAFQTWVARGMFPKATVQPFLMLADKSTKADVDGLHQRFLIEQKNGGSRVVVRPGTDLKTVGRRILREQDVTEEVAHLIDEHEFAPQSLNLRLPEYARFLAKQMADDAPAPIVTGSFCKGCEFRIGAELRAKGLASGFEECWKKERGLSQEALSKPLIFDLWNCTKSGKFLDDDKVLLKDLEREDVNDRQWHQVAYALGELKGPAIDREGLKEAMAGWKYPLHFIDFETTMVAIPFHKGRTPYEQIAFQFSHHTMTKDGKIAHVDQYIHDRVGEFPNFEFVRRLKRSLEGDNGTIFRYADHENTVLRQILRQLEATPPKDRDELVEFIRTVTRPSAKEEGEVPGPRAMVDLKKLVVDHIWLPEMGGSNSIKKVLPAILANSKELQQKYSRADYGSAGGIPSLNFKDWAWIEFDEAGKVKDPYKKLPPVFKDVDQAVFQSKAAILADDAIDDGGAAMTAWARMQFTEMTDAERAAIRSALLKYCELDTLAMAWLVEWVAPMLP